MCFFRRVGFDGNFIRMTLLVPEGQRRKIQVSALGSLTRRQRSLVLDSQNTWTGSS